MTRGSGSQLIESEHKFACQFLLSMSRSRSSSRERRKRKRHDRKHQSKYESRHESKHEGRHKRRRFEEKEDSETRDKPEKRQSKWGFVKDIKKDEKPKNLFISTNPAISIISNPSKNLGIPGNFKEKIYFPNDGVNYIGLLIGPKGMFQKT